MKVKTFAQYLRLDKLAQDGVHDKEQQQSYTEKSVAQSKRNYAPWHKDGSNPYNRHDIEKCDQKGYNRAVLHPEQAEADENDTIGYQKYKAVGTDIFAHDRY